MCMAGPQWPCACRGSLADPDAWHVNRANPGFGAWALSRIWRPNPSAPVSRGTHDAGAANYLRPGSLELGDTIVIGLAGRLRSDRKDSARRAARLPEHPGRNNNTRTPAFESPWSFETISPKTPPCSAGLQR